MCDKINGVINVYKEKGYTSHDVVALVRKMLNKKIKVGHTGTLDPDAEGVLPICIGRTTKLSNRIMSDNKEYVATFQLGIKTDTLDISGEILEKKEDFDFTYDEKVAAIESFVGTYEQIPPMYSAIKVDGKKLYELAREGKEIERKSRTVNIYGIDILKMEKDLIKMKVRCSKGTYIRTLCSDIGDKLGVGATMTELIRTESGVFNIENSIKLKYLKNLNDNKKISSVILTVKDILQDYQKMIVSKKANKYLYNGNKINKSFVSKYNEEDEEINFDEEVVLLDYKNEIIGIYKLDDEEMLTPQVFLMDR